MFHLITEELLHFVQDNRTPFVGIQIALALIREEFPWIYDVGIETLGILRSRRSRDEKQAAIDDFSRLLHFSFEHTNDERNLRGK